MTTTEATTLPSAADHQTRMLHAAIEKLILITLVSQYPPLGLR